MRSYRSIGKLVADQVSRVQIDILHSDRGSPLTSFKHEKIRTNIIIVESRTEINTAIHDADQSHRCGRRPPGGWVRKLVLDDASAIRAFAVQVLNGSHPDIIHEFYEASIRERIVKTLITGNTRDSNLTVGIIRAWNGLDAQSCYGSVGANDITKSRRSPVAPSKAPYAIGPA